MLTPTQAFRVVAGKAPQIPHDYEEGGDERVVFQQLPDGGRASFTELSAAELMHPGGRGAEGVQALKKRFGTEWASPGREVVSLQRWPIRS